MPSPHPPSEDVQGGEGDGATTYSAPQSLREPVLTGLKWILGGRYTREILRLAVGILLARVLTPAQWGVAGAALVVVSLLDMLTDFALPAALIQRPRITEEDRSTMFWTCLGIGTLFTLFAIAISGLVADFFGEPQVQSLFAVASLGFVINSVEKVPGSLLTREFAWRALELRQIASYFVGAAVAVALALAGAGPWAIIGNSLATTTTSAVLLWILTSWRPRWVFSWSSFRGLTGFGVGLLGSQLLTYFQLNMDKLLIGRYLGAASLGTYSFAYQLMFTPILNLGFPLQGVLFPVFATIQDDHERLSAAWLRGKRLAVAIMAPAFLTLIVVAPDLVPAVFGSKWEEAVPVLQLLCLAGVAYSLGTQNWILLMSTGRLRTLFGLTSFITAVTTVGVIVGLHWGITGVAAALVVAYTVIVLPETWIVTRAVSISFTASLRASFSPLPFAAAGAALGYAVRLGLVEVGVPAGVRFVLAGAVCIVAYAVLAFIGSAPLRYEAQEAFRRYRRRKGNAGGSALSPEPL